jgi:signal transduction histidine kinase
VTGVVRHQSAGEKARLYSRRENRPAATPPSDGPAEQPVHGFHPLLLEQLGPAYVADAAGRLTWVNEAFRHFTQRVFASPIGPDGSIETPSSLTDIFEVLRTTGQFEPQHIELTIGGVHRHYLGRHFISEIGDAVSFVGHFEDITRRTLAEKQLSKTSEKLNYIIRSTSDWVWETDTGLRLTEVSARIAAITGTPPDTLLGKPLLTLGRLPETAHGMPTVDELMRSRRAFRNRLFLMFDETSQERRIHLSGAPFFDEETGDFLGYRGTGTDITRALEAERQALAARQQLEDTLDALETRNHQLRDTLSKAQAASEAKSDFLALTSHELRTPLNAIIGFAELCRRQVGGPISERTRGYVENIISAADHLVQIIDNLLDTVRIENETADLDLQQLNVSELIADCVKLVENRARDREIVLVTPPPNRDYSVIGDRTAARQILINLLTNAIKFTPEGGTVGVDVASDTEDRLDITVWDTGIGIPKEQQALVFDRFHRVRSNAFTTNTEGVGIGLHVARSLAHLMGGDISLESEPERGSRFTLSMRPWDQTKVAKIRALAAKRQTADDSAV